MTLFETFETLPSPGANHLTFGKNARGDILPLGKSPRLTIGERILNTYKQFYQIGLGARQEKVGYQARSASGRLEFTVTLDLEYFVCPDRAQSVLTWDGDPVEQMLRSMERDVVEEATNWDIREYMQLQWKLKEDFDHRVTRPKDFPLIVERVTFRVDPPADVALSQEQIVNLKDLNLQIADAELRGDKQKATQLREAKKVLHEIRQDEADGIVLTADIAIGLRSRINAMMDEGFMRDDPAVQAIQKKLDEFAMSEHSTRHLPDEEAGKSKRIAIENDESQTHGIQGDAADDLN